MSNSTELLYNLSKGQVGILIFLLAAALITVTTVSISCYVWRKWFKNKRRRRSDVRVNVDIEVETNRNDSIPTAPTAPSMPFLPPYQSGNPSHSTAGQNPEYQGSSFFVLPSYNEVVQNQQQESRSNE